jgi:glycosyltransferase involved in cell wall biosynthesis
MDKKVLIVSHTFPPDSQVGALRPGSFAKYLPLCGWKPYTLTRHIRYIEKVDLGLQGQMEKYGTIHSTLTIPHPMQWYRSLKSTFGKYTARTEAKLSGGSKTTCSSVRNSLRKLLFTFLYIPDEHWGWIPFAVCKGVQIIRKENISIIYSTAPPWTSHIVGLFLKLVTNCFWIADFRDPWSQNPLNSLESSHFISKRISRFLEQKILQEADSILCVTDELADSFNEMYTNRFKNKMNVIPNGYDQEELNRIQKYERNNHRFTITFSGEFYGSPQNEIPFDDLLVRFVGSCESLEYKPLREILAEMRLTDLVVTTGHLQRQEALKYVIDSDVLLLVPVETKLQIPVKLYEYLAAGRPILAIAGEGAIKNLLLQTGTGLVIQPDDITGLKDAVKTLYYQWKMNKCFRQDSNIVQTYERKKLTAQFSKLLEQSLFEPKSVR